ncbi:MAG: hypothetical protein ACRC8S_22775 [Fimbriiglobus sp.]
MTESVPKHRMMVPRLWEAPTAAATEGQQDLSVAVMPLLAKFCGIARAALQFRERIRELQTGSPEARWGVPKLFFFHPRIQADVAIFAKASPEAAYERRAAELLPREADAWRALPGLADDLLSLLMDSVEARHTARAFPSLRSYIEALATEHPRLRELAQTLMVTDDQFLRIINPMTRQGYRLFVRGLTDINALTDALQYIAPTLHRQFFHPEALLPDGSLPQGLAGADGWYWGREPISTVPLIDGERTLFYLEPARAPIGSESQMRVRIEPEVRLVEELSADWITNWLTTAMGAHPTAPTSYQAA